jgi:AraC-like DNA-binding protein
VLYQGYKKQIVEQSSVVSEKFINQAEYYSMYTLGWAKSYIYQLYLDDQVYNLMFDSNENLELTNSRYLKIKQAASMIPSIQSIYVYNRNTKTIYSSDGNTSNYSLFYDAEIINYIKDTNESLSARFIPRQINVPVNGKEYRKNVLTILLTNTKADIDGTPYGAVVLNLDANVVQAYFDNISQSDYNIMAISKKGEVILSSNRDMFLKNASSQNYINKVIAQSNSSGSFFSSIEGKPSIVTYKYSKELDLILVNVVRYESLMGSILVLMKSIVAAYIILFILGLVFSIFSSKKIYSPIANTLSSIRRYMDIYNDIENKFDLEEASRNEMEYVTKVIDGLMNKPISFAKLSEKDLKFIKEQLLKGILLNTTTDFESLKDRLKDAGYDTTDRNIVLVLYKFDSYNELIKKHSGEEFKALKNKICIEVAALSQKCFESEAVGMGEDEICLIIRTNDELNKELTNKIVKLIEETQQQMLLNLNISLSASIGRYIDKIEELTSAYKTAKDCINYRFKYGFRSILFNDKITLDICGDSKYDEDIEEAIFKAVKLGNVNEVEEELNNMFLIIGKMSYSDMIISTTQLGINSQKIINNIYYMGKENAYIDIKEFTNNLSKFETIQEVKMYFLDLYKNAIVQLKDKKASRKNDVIEAVKKYINQNYADQMLSLEVIANEMKLSANYLRVLFKDSEGKSISNYINEIRFEKAKELLETTELTAIEVSSRVGFANCNYFYTAFKKYYGVSPNQFRNSINNVSL